MKKFRRLDIIKPSKKEFWLWFLDYTNGEMINMACISKKMLEKDMDIDTILEITGLSLEEIRTI